LFIYSNAVKFKKKISSLDGAFGLVFDTSNHSFFSKNDSAALSLWLKEKKCDLLDKFSFYAEDVSRQVNAFFAKEYQDDPKRLFAYSSKVILSINKYPEIQKIFLVNAFVKKNRSSNLIIFCDDREVRNLLKAIFLGEKKFKLELPSIYAWLRFLRTLLRVFFSSKPKYQVKRLFLTLANSFPTNTSDTYFGDLPSKLCNDQSNAIVCICAGKQVVFDKKSNVIVLESFSDITNVLSAWFSSFTQSLLISFKTPKVGKDLLSYELSKFIRNMEIKKGDFFYYSFLSLTFKNLFSILKPSILVYPFENRSWEKLLLLSAYEAQCLKTVGYQHSSITPRHLSLKISKREFNTKEYPNKIITVGSITFDWLKRNSPAIADRIIIGGSLRKIKAKFNLPESKGILVAISSSLDEAKKMLLIVNEVSKGLTNPIPIIVRSHPTINIDTLFNSMSWPTYVVLSKNRDLNQDIFESHIIIYSSSTVAIEGMLCGRLPIFLNIGDCPSGDPLLGKSTFSSSSSTEILSILNQLANFNKIELKRAQIRAIKFSEKYLQDINPEEFIDLL
jgi:hypothetical protein